MATARGRRGISENEVFVGETEVQQHLFLILSFMLPSRSVRTVTDCYVHPSCSVTAPADQTDCFTCHTNRDIVNKLSVITFCYIIQYYRL